MKNIIKLMSIIMLLQIFVYAEDATDATTRSGAILNNLNMSETLEKGKTYTIYWSVFSYLDMDSSLVIYYPNSSKKVIEGTRLSRTQSTYSVSSQSGTIYSYEHKFKTTFTVPDDISNGAAKVGFYTYIRNDYNPIGMFALIPAGVISKPLGLQGKMFEVSITGSSTSSVNIVDSSYYNHGFEQPLTFTINGNGLKDNLQFFIHDCMEQDRLINTNELVQYQCIPKHTAGYKWGVIKDSSGKTLRNFNVFVKDDTNAHYDYLQGIDVSHYQGYINWSLVANDADQIKFAYIKATEGYLPLYTSESTLISQRALDSRFKENITNAIANNIFSGLYHFARPDLNRGLTGAENEAKHFARFAKAYYQNNEMLPPALDVENPNGVNFKSLFSAYDLSLWVQTWLETVEEELGIRPIVYTYGGYNSYLYGLNDYDLWVARYSMNDGLFRTLNWFDDYYKPTVGNWNKWSMWQYTSSGASYVDGIYSGGLDRNVFLGNLDSLKQWAKDHKIQ